MELTESYTLPVPPQRVWEALADAEILRASIPGCERIEAPGDDAFVLTMSVSLDGVKTRLKGRMRLTEIDAPHACTLLFDVETGAAAGGAGKVMLKLEADGDASTTLSYTAHVPTDAVDGAGGVMRKVAGEFFKRFVAQVTARGNELPTDAPQPPEPSVLHAAVAESAPSGRGEKSQKAWTSKF